MFISIAVLKKDKNSSSKEAIGYGNSEDEALKNALNDAVSQVVGVLVDAKEVTSNGKLIKDKVLTYSNGFVQSYKKLSSSEQMGLYEVKIEAYVTQDKLQKKLKAINLKKHRKNRAFTGTLKKHGVKISMDGKGLAWIIFS